MFTEDYPKSLRCFILKVKGNAARLILSSSIGVILFAGMLWFVGVDRLWLSMEKASPAWLAVSASMLLPFYLVRAWRWRMILTPVKNPVKLSNVFWITAIGYLVNTLIPIRLGELVRAVLLDRKEKTGFFEGASSIIIERILDLFGIVMLGALALVLLPKMSLPAWIFDTLRVVVLVVAATLIILLAGTRAESKIIAGVSHILSAIRFPAKWREKILGYVGSLVKGARPVAQNPRLLLSALALTWVLWLSQFLAFYFVFKAFNYTVPWTVILLGFSFMMITYALPAAPGYVGSYEFFWSVVFVGLGLTRLDLLLAMAIVSHLLGIVVQMAVGFLGLVWLGVSFQELLRIRPTQR